MAFDEEDLRRLQAGSTNPNVQKVAREQLEMGVPGAKPVKQPKAASAPADTPSSGYTPGENTKQPPRLRPKIAAAANRVGELGKRFSEGFLDTAIGKTLGTSFASKPTAGPEDAKESGKQSPPTGDSGKDTVNAIRDLQSDLNTQTGILRQTNGILESQSKLMGDGFSALARQLANIKPSESGGGGGSIIGDILGAAGGAAAGGKGMLGRLGGLAKGAGKVLSKAGPLAALGMGAYDAYQGWGEAKENFDLKEDQEATTGQKLSSSIGNAVSGLSFGLLDKKTVAQGIHGAGDWVSNLFSGNSIDERRAKNIPQKNDEPKKEKQQGTPVYTPMGDFTGTYETPSVASPVKPPAFRSGALDQVPAASPATPDQVPAASPAIPPAFRSGALDQVPAPSPVTTPGFRSGALDQVPNAIPVKTAAMNELAQKEEQKKAEVEKEKDKDSMLYSAKELSFKAENVKFEVTGNFTIEATGGMQVVTKAGAGQAGQPAAPPPAPIAPPPPGPTAPGAEPPPTGTGTVPSGAPAAPPPPATTGGGMGGGGLGGGISAGGGGGPMAAPVSPGGAPGGAAERTAARQAGMTPGAAVSGGGQPNIPAGGFGEATKGTGLSGMLPESSLKPIGQGGHRAIPAAADAFSAMRQAAAADGVKLSVTDSYRSYAAQVDVKRRKPNLAATPGKSNHGWGLAFDMSFGSNRNSKEFQWMQQNAGKFGFSGPLPNPNEPWHWTYTGGKADPTAGPVAGKGEGASKDDKAKVAGGEPPPQGAGGSPAGGAPAGAGLGGGMAGGGAGGGGGGAGGGGGMLGGALKSKETDALAGAIGGGGGDSSKMSSMSSGMAAQRDAASMAPAASGQSSPTINNSFGSQSQGGEPRSSNKVESAMPPGHIFHELFGIGAGGKGSTSFSG
jgi:D-alanyl-D-alanine carboxypeptidase